jgi:hypothetical protein
MLADPDMTIKEVAEAFGDLRLGLAARGCLRDHEPGTKSI